MKWLIGLAILIAVAVGSCFGSPAATATNAALPALSWVPPADGYDWIQLKSGEWLKGRIKAMQDRDLEFDSEELDELTFDWKDIRQVRSAHSMDILLGTDRGLLQKGDVLSGRVTGSPDEVRVDGETSVVVPRNQIQSFTPGGSRLNYWSGKGSLGLTLRGGNTDQVEYNASASLQRRTPATRFTLDYLGNISSVDNVESVENHRINGEFDLWLSRRVYLLLPFFEYYRDPFQNLYYRLTVGVGVGYTLIDRPTLEWNITAGPAYQYSMFESVEPGEPSSKSAEAVVCSTHLDWEITRRVDLLVEYRLQYTPRGEETTHHSEYTLSLEITRRVDLDLSFIWDRVDNPQIGEDGVEPKKDDYRLVVGLGWDF